MGFFTRIASVEPEQAADRLRARDAVVVDVRTRAEWKAGRIRGAVHVPLHELSARIGAYPATGRSSPSAAAATAARSPLGSSGRPATTSRTSAAA